MKLTLKQKEGIVTRLLQLGYSICDPDPAIETRVAKEFNLITTPVADYLRSLRESQLQTGEVRIKGVEDWMLERTEDLADSIATPGLDENVRDDVKVIARTVRRLGQLEGRGVVLPERYQKILDIFEEGGLYV